jgi:histidine triad (HIT) family protein
MVPYSMEDCVFCKIVEGKLPSYKVFENEKFFALLDIYPRTKGHTLVIPKKHHRWVYDVPEFGEYWEVALTVSKGIQKALNPTFISFVTHGLDIAHAHIHIFPRYGEKGFVPDVMKIPADEMQRLHEKISAAIPKQ